MNNSTTIPVLDDSTRLISIPILKDFLEDEVIGEVRVRSDALPPTPEFLFSIGYRTNAIPGGPYELVCASIVPNDRYHKYLHTKTNTTEALCVKPELGSMKEFEEAAQLVTDVYSCATRGEALALVLSYRKSIIENLLEDKI